MCICICVHIYIHTCITSIWTYSTSSTAQGGGGSFKNRKPIGETCCCGAKMAERTHWWIERWLCVFLWRHDGARQHSGSRRFLSAVARTKLQRITDADTCNELRMLIRHRAVRKDTHAGPQRIRTAAAPSCGQKRHTRWPATNSV